MTMLGMHAEIECAAGGRMARSLADVMIRKDCEVVCACVNEGQRSRRWENERGWWS